MMDCTQKRFSFCLFVLSAIVLIWLMADLFYPEAWKGSFQVTDPDSVLFLRLLEQSILKQTIIDNDSYGAYPYEIDTGIAPFYIRFLVYFVNIVYSLFPNLEIDPIYVAGILPLVIPWFTAVMLVFSMHKLAENKVLSLFCAFGMLPGFAFSMYSAFGKLDYDYLINFYIWSWIICCSFYLKSNKHYIVYIASVITALFISTWNGSPFFFFFVTMYGFVIWLIAPKKHSDYLTFASISMFIGSICALIFVPRTELSWNYFISGSVEAYSYLQGSLVLIGALFLSFLKYINRFSRPRSIGLCSICAILLLFVCVFHNTILSASGLLLKKDPIHSTISELLPGIELYKIFDDELFKGLTRFGPLVCFFPLIFIVVLPEFKRKKELQFLIYWLVIFFIMLIYQVRYFRWIGCGYGLLVGFACYSLWEIFKRYIGNARFAMLKMSLAIIPIMLIFLTTNFIAISSDAKLNSFRIELYQWIKEYTPPTSGYDNNDVPEYGILPYWDEGNYISYYTKRPTAVGNTMWGYKTMADVFSAENEQCAFDLCKKYKLRYIIVEPGKIIAETLLKYWPIMKDMPEGPRYRLYYKDLPDRESFNYFYFWLTNHVGLTKLGDFGTSSHFRLVFANTSERGTISKYLMFQCVDGALVQFKMEPDTKISMSMELKASKIPFIYKVNGVTDKNGLCEFRLPYANGYNSGQIITDSFYKVSFEKDGKRKLAKLTVPENVVVDGLNLDLEKHLSYLSTF